MAAAAVPRPKVVVMEPLELHEGPDLLPEDRWKTTSDSHVVVRETPPWKVRERWAKILLRKREMELQNELHALHHAEHFDHELPPAAPVKEPSRWEATLDFFGTAICRFAHHPPTFAPGDHVSSCPSCGRRFILPWGDRSKVEGEVYAPSDKFIKPNEPTKQAVCRHGRFGDC